MGSALDYRVNRLLCPISPADNSAAIDDEELRCELHAS